MILTARSVQQKNYWTVGFTPKLLNVRQTPRLDEGVPKANEVLPNPKNRSRALVVLHNVSSGSPKIKHGVSVLDLSANGTWIDVVSSMTAPDSYLAEAKVLADEIENAEKTTWLEVRRFPHPRCLLICTNSITRQPTFRSSAKPISLL